MTGTDASLRGVAAVLDPAACNAAQHKTGGLLVPRSEVAGIAPGGAVLATCSVDVDVTPPAVGARPETWTVGARLTPVSAVTGPMTIRVEGMRQHVGFNDSA